MKTFAALLRLNWRGVFNTKLGKCPSIPKWWNTSGSTLIPGDGVDIVFIYFDMSKFFYVC